MLQDKEALEPEDPGKLLSAPRTTPHCNHPSTERGLLRTQHPDQHKPHSLAVLTGTTCFTPKDTNRFSRMQSVNCLIDNNLNTSDCPVTQF